MKSLFVATIALSGNAAADLIAHMGTDRGIVNIELHFQEAPISVANFMTLAMGSRSRIDSTTGAVTDVPLYVGETFFRTTNNDSFKFAQTGSGTGSNNGHPGFTIRDEFDPNLRHTGYKLSMANTGRPNSGSGQIFFTGDVTIDQYDDLHTIFGSIPDDDSTVPGNTKLPEAPSSRDVMDSIIGAGDDQTTITSITFTRDGAEALAFDEHDQGLPIVTERTGNLIVDRDVSTNIEHPDPLAERTALVPFRSPDLKAWSELDEDFAGYDAAPRSMSNIDSASLASAFYRFAAVNYPRSPTPDSLANQTFNIDATPFVAGDYTAEFDDTGASGTLTYTPDDTAEEPLVGAMTTVIHYPSGTGGILMIVADGMRPIRLEIGYDADSPESSESIDPPSSPIPGRHRFSLWQGFWQVRGTSDLSVTF